MYILKICAQTNMFKYPVVFVLLILLSLYIVSIYFVCSFSCSWWREKVRLLLRASLLLFEQPHDKTNNVVVRPAKTQISLGIRPVWSESSLSAWRKLGSLATHWAHSEDSNQTGRMPRLIWVFAGRRLILLVLSRDGSLLWCRPQSSHILYPGYYCFMLVPFHLACDYLF